MCYDGDLTLRLYSTFLLSAPLPSMLSALSDSALLLADLNFILVPRT